ncbi:MAG: ribose-phosphate pyrophosphokinase [Gammaproteobacteria bacterium]
MQNHKLKIFTGNANPKLANAIAHYLHLPMGDAYVGRFSDGEIRVEIRENVRGSDVFLIQPTCAPCNDNLMELMILADALRRASAATITAVIPYYGYARQDRRVRSARVPITAKVVADMLASVGISRVVTVDLHADQIQGFFHMPVDNVYASPVLIDDILQVYDAAAITVVSPDVGGVVRARAFAKQLNDAQLAIIDKRRPQPNASEVMNIIGEVTGNTCIIVDDLVDTAGTLCAAAHALKQNGAAKVVAYCSHAVLSGEAVNNIQQSSLDELVVTDTIPLTSKAQNCGKIRQLSLAGVLSEALRRIREAESLSFMFPE